jgi:hypothetical protein
MSKLAEVPHPFGRRRVRVWFGEHPIATYVAEPALASRYEAAMQRRFAGLRVTNEPAVAVVPDADLS